MFLLQLVFSYLSSYLQPPSYLQSKGIDEQLRNHRKMRQYLPFLTAILLLQLMQMLPRIHLTPEIGLGPSLNLGAAETVHFHLHI